MKNKKNLKITHDIKIMTSKYNPEVKESRKKKKKHPSVVNTRLFCVNKFSWNPLDL